jgi:hypothetical protein
MKTEAQIQERIDFIRKQIKTLKEMVSDKMSSHRYDDNVYYVIQGYSDELNLLKWVLNQDQPDAQEKCNPEQSAD